MLSMAILVSFVRWSLWNSRAPRRSWADSLWNEGRGCEAARSRQKQLVSQGVPRWRLLPPKWCRCVPGPPGPNPHCRMTLLSPGFIDTVSSSDLTAWLSAPLMLRCEGAVRGEGRWTLGPPMTGDHHCRDLHSSLLLTWVVVLALPPVQKNLKKMTQLRVISDCDYLRANYWLLHHHLACSCLPPALLLLTTSLSLALPPVARTARRAEESVLTSAAML